MTAAAPLMAATAIWFTLHGTIALPAAITSFARPDLHTTVTTVTWTHHATQPRPASGSRPIRCPAHRSPRGSAVAGATSDIGSPT